MHYDSHHKRKNTRYSQHNVSSSAQFHSLHDYQNILNQ